MRSHTFNSIVILCLVNLICNPLISNIGLVDQVGAEEEELAGDEVQPPAGGSHGLGLRGEAGRLLSVHPAGTLKE